MTTMTRTTQSLTVWIVCFAILLAALAPSFSTVLAAVNGVDSSWTEICSSVGAGSNQGVNKGNADKFFSVGKPVAPAGKISGAEHCPYCLTHAASFGLPPTAFSLLPVTLSIFSFIPTLFYRSPRPLFMWAAAQSRAPPLIS